MEIAGPYDSTATDQTMTIDGISQVWNDKFLKQYGTALIKKQWGNNMKKYGGMQLAGGITMNGQQVFDEAVGERRDMHETILMHADVHEGAEGRRALHRSLVSLADDRLGGDRLHHLTRTLHRLGADGGDRQSLALGGVGVGIGPLCYVVDDADQLIDQEGVRGEHD